MIPTEPQTIMLAAIEREHGQLKRIPDDSELGDGLLCNCVTDTRAYRCLNCEWVFTIEPDGETNVWVLAPLVD